MRSPTASHLFDAVQETLRSSACAAPPGLGVVCSVHALPFHRSASVRGYPAPLLSSPTAVHASWAVQLTAVSSGENPPPAPAWTVHAVPSHVSASVFRPDVGSMYSPTAVQKSAAVQETPSRAAS